MNPTFKKENVPTQVFLGCVLTQCGKKKSQEGSDGESSKNHLSEIGNFTPLQVWVSSM